jgi:hypothetical protein
MMNSPISLSFVVASGLGRSLTVRGDKNNQLLYRPRVILLQGLPLFIQPGLFIVIQLHKQLAVVANSARLIADFSLSLPAAAVNYSPTHIRFIGQLDKFVPPWCNLKPPVIT